MTIEKDVSAPPERVFAAATDIPRWAERISAIERVEILTDGPVGVGTRFRETRTMFGKQATEEMEIVAFDPPRSYALAAESHGCRYDTSLRFEPRGTGTHVVMRFDAEPRTTMAKLLGFLTMPLMKGMVVKQCARDLDDLARAVEGSR